MLEPIDAVASDLDALDVVAVFTGASTLALLVTDPVVREVLRYTRDVDVIVRVADLPAYQRVQAELRQRGYEDRLDEDAPMCRLWREGVPVDLMPCPDHGIGTDNRWFLPGSQRPARVLLPSGREISVLGPVYFAAAKVEAFRSRGVFDGALDWFGAPDLEDLISLVDGRPDLAERLAAAPLDARRHVALWAAELLALPDASDVIAGNSAGSGRAALLAARLRAIADVPLG